MLIDAVIVTIGAIIIAMLADIENNPDSMEEVLVGSWFTFYWLYYSIMESSPAQGTVGKIALRIKVTDLKGNRIGFMRAAGRQFGKLVSNFIFHIGYLMIALTEKKQGQHDKIARCLVIDR